MRRLVGGLVLAAVVVFGIPVAAGFLGFIGTATSAAACTGTPGQQGRAPMNASLFKAIGTDASGNPRLQLSMLEGSYLESGWSNTSEGGGAFGPFQIQDPGAVNLGVTIAQAENPAFATNYMYPRYKAAMNNVNPALWASDPELAAEQTAFNAERPKFEYILPVAQGGRGKPAVDLAYHMALQAMQRMGANPRFGNAPATQAASFANCTTLAVTNAKGARAALLKTAFSQRGVPYVWGGITPQLNGHPGAFDCSGFVQWSFQQIHINLPRTSEEQWTFTNSHTVTTNYSQAVAKAQPGDLVFFAGSDGTITSPGHIGIYIGNGKMIDAPQTGETVHIQPIYPDGFVGITNPYFK